MSRLGGAHGPGRPNVTLVDQYGNPLIVGTGAGNALHTRDTGVLEALQEQTLLLKQIRLGLSLLTNVDLSREAGD